MITNTLLGLGMILGMMGYVSIKHQIKELRVDNVANIEAIGQIVEIQVNKIVKEVQEGSNTIIKGVGSLADNVNNLNSTVVQNKEVSLGLFEETKKDINENTAKQVARIIYLAPVLKIK